MDKNIGVVKMKSAVLDVEVLEGEAGVRELEDVFLGYDHLKRFAIINLIGIIFASASSWLRFARFHLKKFFVIYVLVLLIIG